MLMSLAAANSIARASNRHRRGAGYPIPRIARQHALEAAFWSYQFHLQTTTQAGVL